MTADCQIQRQAFLEKVHPDIIHQFDVWHVSKSIKKKLSQKLAKCKKLTKWSKSIINHVWWCCRTCEGDQELLKEKWVCLLFDIRNMTEFCHTGQIKVFNSLINKYSPKRLHFFTASQYAQHQLSVIDHNIGTERDYVTHTSQVLTLVHYL